MYPEQGKIVVLGPARSGTRLLTDIINQSPDLKAFHEGSHGQRIRNRGAKGYILLTRDKKATLASQENPSDLKRVTWWPDINWSLQRFLENYVLDMWITYEDIVADINETISRIAKVYDVPVWKNEIEIYDGNERHLNNEDNSKQG